MMEKAVNPFFEYMSEQVKSVLSSADFSHINEVRLRRHKPLSVHFSNDFMFVSKSGIYTKNAGQAYIVTDCDIDTSMELICGGSIYSHQDEIRNGYVTVCGGHRVGICGRAVEDNGKITFIKNVSGLNFRYAREVLGAADKIMNYIICGGGIKNTLIISAPSYGKTTVLRDIARQISNRGHKVFIADERGELASMADGVSGYDIGSLTDVTDGCAKADAMMMAVRSMSPELIISDEIGHDNDFDALCSAAGCGVSVIASMHAKNALMLFKNKKYRERLAVFDVFVTLGRQKIESVQTYDELKGLEERCDV